MMGQKFPAKNPDKSFTHIRQSTQKTPGLQVNRFAKRVSPNRMGSRIARMLMKKANPNDPTVHIRLKRLNRLSCISAMNIS